jgi:hypothetical protein
MNEKIDKLKNIKQSLAQFISFSQNLFELEKEDFFEKEINHFVQKRKMELPEIMNLLERVDDVLYESCCHHFIHDEIELESGAVKHVIYCIDCFLDKRQTIEKS